MAIFFQGKLHRLVALSLCHLVVPTIMGIEYQQASLHIEVDRQGASEYVKMSYPLRSGIYSVVEDEAVSLHFNRNGELIRAQGKGRSWDHPHEWLKRSMGNDWIYYSTGGYRGVFEATGEYYLPNLQYTTNALLGGKPFAEPQVRAIVDGWYQRLRGMVEGVVHAPDAVEWFLAQALANTPQRLAEKAQALRTVCGGRISVLPPDARHVDYNVIPLLISEGCLYKCRFCKVKNGKPFRCLSKEEIAGQLRQLKVLYGRDLVNFNAVFLGEHDALQAGAGHLPATAALALEELDLTRSAIQGANMFLFGSVGALLESPQDVFADLARLPATFYINVGLESADQATLDRLGKPVTSAQVRLAFARMQDINDRYANIEMTANFVMDDDLPDSHVPSMMALLRDGLTRTKIKGTVYLSPLAFGRPSRSQLFVFNRLKRLSRVPTFLYIIQRL